MKLDANTIPYLHGEKFSNGLPILYPYYESIPNRIKLLTELATGKKVIHLGCLDHLPLIDQKISNQQWLHKELTTNSTKCLGIDIDAETLDYVKTKYGIDNVILRDITGAPISEITSEKWDYAILGELMEHIDNPVAYLTEINKKYNSSIDKIIITVPNVLTMKAFRYAKKSTEIINTDHRYWFTPYTIAKVMHRAGIQVDDILFANRVPLSTIELIAKKIITLSGRQPKYGFQYASSIVAIGKLK